MEELQFNELMVTPERVRGREGVTGREERVVTPMLWSRRGGDKGREAPTVNWLERKLGVTVNPVI